MPPPNNAPSTRGGLAVLGATALAIGCCAAVPLTIAALGGASVAAIFGVTAGLLALVSIVALIAVIHRRRRGESQ